MPLMQDLVRFEAGSAKTQNPALSLELVSARSLPANAFASCETAQEARALLKRARFVHMPVWWVDAGLARLMADAKCAMVIGLSDLLDGPVSERGKRLARSKKMAELVLHFGGRVRVCSLARSEREVRNPLELMCAAEEMGVSLKQAKMEMERKIFG